MSKIQMYYLDFYLVIGYNQNNSFWKKLRVVKTPETMPSLKFNEVAIKVNIRLPETLFNKPQFQANITIDENKVASRILNAEVQENITKIVNQQLGVDLNIHLIEPEESEEK